MNLATYLCQTLNASEAIKLGTLQRLWSGYGEIARYKLLHNGKPQRYIVKLITPPKNALHPYQWNSDIGHQRKLHSYQVERQWYQHWSKRCHKDTVIPVYYQSLDDKVANQTIIILSDLDQAGFTKRYEKLDSIQALAVIKWLAIFHASFIKVNPNPQWPEGLWTKGTYWHLETRQEEYNAMPDSQLKRLAAHIDAKLTQCPFQTIVHGDAKVANFCFSEQSAPTCPPKVAAVDFQYVGGGVGIKDLIYFLGSALSEHQLENGYESFINAYFSILCAELQTKFSTSEIVNIEQSWRELLPFAWADFQRFLVGWQPQHHKLNNFSQSMTQIALDQDNL